MSDRPHRLRQYAGLALVIIAYVGGIIGWSCAVLEVDNQSSSAADTTQAHHTHAESLPLGAPRLVAPPIAQSTHGSTPEGNVALLQGVPGTVSAGTPLPLYRCTDQP